MKTIFLAQIGITFPRSKIHFTQFGGELKDTSGEMIGYVSKTECFVMRSEYTHFDKAKRALEKNGVNHEVQSNVRALYE